METFKTCLYLILSDLFLRGYTFVTKYMIEIKLRVWSKGEKYNQPTGKSGKLIRKKPYPPSFNRIPANKIDPDKGASTCA